MCVPVCVQISKEAYKWCFFFTNTICSFNCLFEISFHLVAITGLELTMGTKTKTCSNPPAFASQTLGQKAYAIMPSWYYILHSILDAQQKWAKDIDFQFPYPDTCETLFIIRLLNQSGTFPTIIKPKLSTDYPRLLFTLEFTQGCVPVGLYINKWMFLKIWRMSISSIFSNYWISN